jgi:hypothetical protein
VGEVSTAVVAGDGQKAFTTSVNSVADKLESFGIAGTMAAEGLRTFTAAVDVSREAVQAFANRGRELAAYNPAIAQARAEADVKLLLLDMKEATKFSAQYVKMIESEVRLNEAWRRSFEPVKARLMDFLANRIVPFMERVAKHVEAGVTKLDLMLTVMENLPKLLTGNFGGFQQAIVDRANELAGGINDDPGLKAGMAALEDWWIKAKQLQPAGHVRGPMQADPKLKLPIMER